jgi:hypothetical protein
MKSSNVVWISLYTSRLDMLSIFVLLFLLFNTLIYAFQVKFFFPFCASFPSFISIVLVLHFTSVMFWFLPIF